MPEQPAPQSAPADQAWTVRRILEWTTNHLKQHGSDTPRLDAEILLAHARSCPRIQLYTHFDDVVSDAVRATMRELVQRRAKAEPVAYLVGQREFFSLSFRVNRDVLIPRPDTETLVMEILDRLKRRESPRLLDLCTGSGCVGVATAKNNSQVKVLATDISPNAITIAQENVERHQLGDRVEIVASDLFASIPKNSRFDVIASNPPYIPSAEIDQLDAEVAKHEPRLALDGGPDGLDILRKIIEQAPAYAAPSGWLMLEFTPEQADSLQKIVQQDGRYREIAIRKDLAHRPRVLRAQFAADA